MIYLLFSIIVNLCLSVVLFCVILLNIQSILSGLTESFLLAPCPSDSTYQPWVTFGPTGRPPSSCAPPIPDLQSATPSGTRVAFSRERFVFRDTISVPRVLTAVGLSLFLRLGSKKPGKTYLVAEGRAYPDSF